MAEISALICSICVTIILFKEETSDSVLDDLQLLVFGRTALQHAYIYFSSTSHRCWKQTCLWSFKQGKVMLIKTAEIQ